MNWIDSVVDWISDHQLQLPCAMIAGGVLFIIGQIVLMRLFPHWRIWKSERCPSCGKFTLNDYNIHFNPRAPFTLGECYSCGKGYVKENGEVIPSENYNGPGIVEFNFRLKENLNRDPQEIFDEIIDERKKSRSDVV